MRKPWLLVTVNHGRQTFDQSISSHFWFFTVVYLSIAWHGMIYEWEKVWNFKWNRNGGKAIQTWFKSCLLQIQKGIWPKSLHVRITLESKFPLPKKPFQDIFNITFKSITPKCHNTFLVSMHYQVSKLKILITITNCPFISRLQRFKGR